MNIKYSISPACISYLQRDVCIAYAKDYEFKSYDDRMMIAAFDIQITHIKRKQA